MKSFAVIIPFILFVVGCDSTPRPVQADPSFRQVRETMRNQAVAYPTTTPFDSVSSQRAAYIKGFCKGWNVAIDQGLGAFASVPDAYQQTKELTEAWKSGYKDGSLTLWTLAERRALETTKSESSKSQ